MKKITLAVIMFLLLISAFASESHRTFFPMRGKQAVFPSDKDLGICVNPESTPEHQLLAKALSEPFDFDWTENYFHPSTKKALASVYSSLLTELLPSENVIFTRLTENMDSSKTITAKFLDSDIIISFVILDDKICAISE